MARNVEKQRNRFFGRMKIGLDAVTTIWNTSAAFPIAESQSCTDVGNSSLPNVMVNGGTYSMKHMILCSLCCWLFLAPTASAQQTSLTKSLWPFRTKKTSTQTAGGMRMPKSVLDKETAGSSAGFFRWASPTNVLQKAEKGTDVMFQRTRSTFKGMQSFGRRLIPFSSQREPKKRRPPFFSRLVPKKRPDPAPPATIGEFLSLPRPDF